MSSAPLRLILAFVLLLAAPPFARAQDESPVDEEREAEDEAEDGAEQGDLLPCGKPSDDDPTTLKARAREHYLRGDELYALGEYERAIPEYWAAYCLVPVPEPIHNIAQAYERLVEYEQAVVWFERYIAELPPDAIEERELYAHRVKVLKRLPARIRVATDPPGADVVLEGGDAPVRGRANAEPLRVLAGTYTMTVKLDGHEPIVETFRVQIGQPYTFSYRLSPKTGQLRVTTDPPDARIFVDQKLVGLGTYVDRVPIGEHTITVEAQGRRPQTREVDVLADRTTSLHVRLDAPPRSGRWELITATTLFGLSAGSIGATVFGQESGAATLFALGGGAVGFAGTYLGAPDRIPVGHTSLVIGSTAWGAVLGLGLSSTFTEDDRVISSVTFSGAIVGGAAAAVAAPKLDLSAGDAALVNSGGLWGTTMGSMFWGLFQEDDRTGRLFGPILLSGLGAGLLAGGALAYKHEFSRGHVALIDLAGLAGAITGTALSNAFERKFESQDRTLHFALGGIVAGLAAGAFFTRNMDEARAARATAHLPSPTLGVARGADGRAVGVLGVSGAW